MADGTIHCSPFHVKLSNVSRKGENKVVKMKLNGTELKLQMKLGRAGEAFFVERAQDQNSRRKKQHIKESLSSPPLHQKNIVKPYKQDMKENFSFLEKNSLLIPS